MFRRLTALVLAPLAAFIIIGCDKTDESSEKAGPCDLNSDGFVSNSEKTSQECLDANTGG